MLFSVKCGWHDTYFRVDAEDAAAARERVASFYVGRGMSKETNPDLFNSIKVVDEVPAEALPTTLS